METVIIEWLGLAFRWIHIITGIAWIGASFYFNWLLNHLMTSDDPKVSGQLWALHAGGFFNVEKRNIEPGKLPEPLHWFKWESYWTWISGFTLLVIVYYFGAEAYLLDPMVADIRPWQGILISLAVLGGSWLFYHILWSSRYAENHNTAAVLITTGFVAVMIVFLTQVFSGRGAFLHVGAMLATWMTANVFYVIMPAQRALVAATQEGREQDKSLARNAGARSLHNNYITLPVLFCMISNHYPATYGSSLNWLILILLFVVGIAVRHYFNIRHLKGTWDALWMLVLAGLLFFLTAVLATVPQLFATTASGPVDYARIQPLVEKHCLACHVARPTSPLVATTPKNVLLDTEQHLITHAAASRTQVMSRAMPLGNLTRMTDEERALLLEWLKQQSESDP
ncbi:MAG TPA: urate hydroxylase PuuD [Thiolinea sp.]|nr:urate hydroxylase PuuD [Thiolinea sp.]